MKSSFLGILNIFWPFFLVAVPVLVLGLSPSVSAAAQAPSGGELGLMGQGLGQVVGSFMRQMQSETLSEMPSERGRRMVDPEERRSYEQSAPYEERRSYEQSAPYEERRIRRERNDDRPRRTRREQNDDRSRPIRREWDDDRPQSIRRERDDDRPQSIRRERDDDRSSRRDTQRHRVLSRPYDPWGAYRWGGGALGGDPWGSGSWVDRDWDARKRQYGSAYGRGRYPRNIGSSPYYGNEGSPFDTERDAPFGFGWNLGGLGMYGTIGMRHYDQREPPLEDRYSRYGVRDDLPRRYSPYDLRNPYDRRRRYDEGW